MLDLGQPSDARAPRLSPLQCRDPDEDVVTHPGSGLGDSVKTSAAWKQVFEDVVCSRHGALAGGLGVSTF